MNKQQLTKTFSFSKWLLFFFFAVGVTLSSCGEDYDDDITRLQQQIDKLGNYNDFQTKLNNMETALAAAQTTADQALATAKEALEKAQSGGNGSTDLTAIENAIKDLEAAQANSDAIKATKEEVEKLRNDVDKKIADLASTGLTEAQLEEIVAKVLASVEGQLGDLATKVDALISHRLTSIAYIPEENINGIPAIKFYSLAYMPQTTVITHDELYPTTQDNGASLVTITTQNKVIRYRMNPRVGVRSTDMLMPSFDCIVSTNDMTKAVDASLAGVNSPIKPVSVGTVLEDGVYELVVTKSVTENVNREWLNVTQDIEKFYMASLNVPISESNYTADEVANGTKPSVHSEYVRIAESTVTPFLKQMGSVHDATSDDVYEPGTSSDPYPHLNEIDVNGKWIHYHDSASLYNSGENVLVDHEFHWNAQVDLKKLVDVCIIEESHKSLENYKDYGLDFRFYLAKEAYLQGINNTDQQQFAVIDSPESGIMTSKVYGIDGPTETAAGREPIIRAELRDIRNGNIVAIRYIKIKWSNTTEGSDLNPYTFPEHLVTCKDVEMRFGTKEMNELVYRQVEQKYGLSKTAFHNAYTNVEIVKMTQDGVDITDVNNVAEPITHREYVVTTSTPPAAAPDDYMLGMIRDDLDNTSYNIVWTMTPASIGKLATIDANAQNYRSTYVLTFKFTGSGNPITMDFIVDIKVPVQTFKYQLVNWDETYAPTVTGSNMMDGNVIFNVNPIVYGTNEDGSIAGGGLIDYSHIEADLMTGYVSPQTGKVINNVAQFIQQIRECADVKFIFDESRLANYSYLSGYTVSTDGVELWNGPVGTSLISTAATTPQIDAPAGEYAYIQDNGMAASISNFFGATADQNYLINLPFDEYNEPLITGNNEALGRVRLHETNELNGTPAAINLVGKKVPVNLVVEYNAYNIIPVQRFEVFFINPLTMTGALTGSFTDATINGSYLDAQEGLTFRDWNSYLVANTPSDNTKPDKDKYTGDLWAYYAVNTVKFDVDNVKTNLQLVGSTIVPVDGVTDGDLPNVVSLVQVRVTAASGNPQDGHVEVGSDPTHLGYKNANGTPVNLDYKLYVPVSVNYKWGVMTKPGVEVEVYKAIGTP